MIGGRVVRGRRSRTSEPSVGYLIGPPGAQRNYPGSLDGTPVFMGSSDVDPHVPLERLYETRDVFTKLGAKVDMRIYPRMGHTVNDDEVQAVQGRRATARRPRSPRRTVARDPGMTIRDRGTRISLRSIRATKNAARCLACDRI